MNTYTGMAIDAFRKVEQAKRRLAQAENAAQQAARLVPREEFDLWVLETEVVRLESMAMTSAHERNQEGHDWAIAKKEELRQKIRELYPNEYR